MFCLLTAVLCGCTGKKANTEFQVQAVEITEEQLYKIYDQINTPGSANIRKGFFANIAEITSNHQLQKFEIKSDKDYEGTYSYNIFKYQDCNLILIYDDSNDLGWICGCIYYNNPVDSEKLKQAKTYDDIKKIDSAVESDSLIFSMVSADILISRNMYTPHFPLLNTEKTLHFTDDGLYLIQYKGNIFETDSPTSSAQKINSIEKIEDKVYNTVYELLCKQ